MKLIIIVLHYIVAISNVVKTCYGRELGRGTSSVAFQPLAHATVDDLERSLVIVALKLYEMKAALKIETKENSNLQAYDAARNVVGREVAYMNRSDIPEVAKINIAKSLAEVSHQLGCMDEILACTFANQCSDAKQRLKKCLSFSFGRFSAEVNELYRKTERLARDFSDMEAPGTVADMDLFNSEIKAEREKLISIKKIDTTRWSSQRDLDKLKKKIEIIGYHLTNMERFSRRINTGIQEHPSHNSGNATSIIAVMESGEKLSLQSIRLKFEEIEAKLTEYMNPSSSSLGDLPRRIQTEKKCFEEIIQTLKSAGIESLNTSYPQILKISYILVMLAS
ncbi:hypothetical protein JCM33374_g4469 [Metschnikowia sp. JCM 33374]|nr:hypothetical protein JCM33374_g4469 [Metschnikowia sp. JCM 33374]